MPYIEEKKMDGIGLGDISHVGEIKSIIFIFGISICMERIVFIYWSLERISGSAGNETGY